MVGYTVEAWNDVVVLELQSSIARWLSQFDQVLMVLPKLLDFSPSQSTPRMIHLAALATFHGQAVRLSAD